MEDMPQPVRGYMGLKVILNEGPLSASRSVLVGKYPINVPSYSWKPNPSREDPLPDGVVCGGAIETGHKSYIGKAMMGEFETQEACGFFTDEERKLHVPYGSAEHIIEEFDILIIEDQSGLHWERCARGNLPSRHIPVFASKPNFHSERMIVGRTCTPLSQGRTYDHLQLPDYGEPEQNVCRPGKIHRSHRCLYVPYSGREYIFNEYEMLMLKKSPGSLMLICRHVILCSMGPYPLKPFVETLPLPPALKSFLLTPPTISESLNGCVY